jgi:Rieske Fe-S protein
MNRRSFLKIFTLGGFAVLGLASLRSLFHLSSRPPRLVFIPSAELEKLKSGPLFGEDYILVKASGGILAFSRKCPHLGCKLNFEPVQSFIFCPCHGSKFTLQGKYISGPAKKDLSRLNTKPSDKGIFLALPT